MSTAATFPETRDWYEATEKISAQTTDARLVEIANYYGLRISDLIRYRATR